jgi:hypothetical protein
LLLFAFVPNCGSRATLEAETPVETGVQEADEIRRLLPGTWELVSIDGREARGWLAFGNEERGYQFSFSLGCGAQHGTYELEGDRVLPHLTTSVAPNCSNERLATAAGQFPELVFGRFQVDVSASSLLVRGRTRLGQSSWARYVRSSGREVLRSGGPKK